MYQRNQLFLIFDTPTLQRGMLLPQKNSQKSGSEKIRANSWLLFQKNVVNLSFKCNNGL